MRHTRGGGCGLFPAPGLAYCYAATPPQHTRVLNLPAHVRSPPPAPGLHYARSTVSELLKEPSFSSGVVEASGVATTVPSHTCDAGACARAAALCPYVNTQPFMRAGRGRWHAVHPHPNTHTHAHMRTRLPAPTLCLARHSALKLPPPHPHRASITPTPALWPLRCVLPRPVRAHVRKRMVSGIH